MNNFETEKQRVYIYISREISIEHPSVGLAQLLKPFVSNPTCISSYKVVIIIYFFIPQ